MEYCSVVLNWNNLLFIVWSLITFPADVACAIASSERDAVSVRIICIFSSMFRAGILVSYFMRLMSSFFNIALLAGTTFFFFFKHLFLEVIFHVDTVPLKHRKS